MKKTTRDSERHAPAGQPPPSGPDPGPATITVQGFTYSMPFADLLPPLTDEVLAALREDIREHGIRVDVVVSDTLEVLDGHHRLKLAAELGITTPVVPKVVQGLTAEQKRDWAVTSNKHRRQLTRAQQRELTRRHLVADPNTSDRAIAAIVGVAHKTVGSVRKAAEATGVIPQSKVRRDRHGRSQAVRPSPPSTAPSPVAPVADTPVAVPDDTPAPVPTPSAKAVAPVATAGPVVAPDKPRWRHDLMYSATQLASWANSLQSLATTKVAERDPADVIAVIDRVTRHLGELRDRVNTWPAATPTDPAPGT